MHSTNGVQVRKVPAGLSGSGTQSYCARCDEPHDPTLHFDRSQFDRAGFAPGSDEVTLTTAEGLQW